MTSDIAFFAHSFANFDFMDMISLSGKTNFFKHVSGYRKAGVNVSASSKSNGSNISSYSSNH